jgi:hypothetical protein
MLVYELSKFSNNFKIKHYNLYPKKVTNAKVIFREVLNTFSPYHSSRPILNITSPNVIYDSISQIWFVICVLLKNTTQNLGFCLIVFYSTGFAHRALWLPSRCSITWNTPSILFPVFLEIGSLFSQDSLGQDPPILSFPC